MLININKKYYFIFGIIVAVVLCVISIKPGSESNKQYKNKLDTVETTTDSKNKDKNKDNEIDESTVVAGAIIEGNAYANEEDREISKEEMEEAKETLGDNIQVSDIEKGTILSLNNEPLYISSIISADSPANYKTGTYYAWGYEAAGRIAITNTAENIGVKGQVTGWINKPTTNS